MTWLGPHLLAGISQQYLQGNFSRSFHLIAVASKSSGVRLWKFTKTDSPKFLIQELAVKHSPSGEVCFQHARKLTQIGLAN